MGVSWLFKHILPVSNSRSVGYICGPLAAPWRSSESQITVAGPLLAIVFSPRFKIQYAGAHPLMQKQNEHISELKCTVPRTIAQCLHCTFFFISDETCSWHKCNAPYLQSANWSLNNSGKNRSCPSRRRDPRSCFLREEGILMRWPALATVQIAQVAEVPIPLWSSLMPGSSSEPLYCTIPGTACFACLQARMPSPAPL